MQTEGRASVAGNVSVNAIGLYWLIGVLFLSLCVRVRACVQEEQAAKLKADNIRVALEKIKEAQVKKVSQEKKKKAAEICVVYLCVCVGYVFDYVHVPVCVCVCV